LDTSANRGASPARPDPAPVVRAESRAPAQDSVPPQISAELQARYDQLLADWNAAVAKQNREQIEAKAQGKPLPPSPHGFLRDRFVELARAGHPGAASWCMQFSSMVASDMVKQREIFLLCEAIVRPFALANEDPARPLIDWPSPFGIPELVRTIQDASWIIGRQDALALCTKLFDQVTQPESKAQVLDTEVNIYLLDPKVSKDPPSAEVMALYRRLANDYPKTEEGQLAAGQIFRTENLQIGKTIPDFATEDVDGVPFKLSDYRGKVIVLDFWGFWVRGYWGYIPHEAKLVERLMDKPFALIGVNTDENKEGFRAFAKEKGVNWRNSWQGSRNGPLVRAWGINRFPKVYVIDHKGVIRDMGKRGFELDALVDKLLAELAAEQEKK